MFPLLPILSANSALIFLVILAGASSGFVLNAFRGNQQKGLKPAESIVVITGCDSGFGESASYLLASEGFQVVACCLTEAGRE